MKSRKSPCEVVRTAVEQSKAEQQPNVKCCKCQFDLIPALTMSEAICAKPQEEYEDDFEKDLDWLISEEGRSEDQVNEASVHVTIYATTSCLSSFTSLALSTAVES